MVLKHVAVTGITGMIGTHLRRLLDEANITYTGASRTTSNAAKPFLKEWDITQWKTPEELNELFPEATALVHLGAATPTQNEQHSICTVFDSNVRASLCLAQWACQRNIPMMYCSGGIVYENPHGKNILESEKKTTGHFGNFYGYSKYLGEKAAQYYIKDGLQLCILRPSSVYGSGLSNNKVIHKFIKAASRGETIELHPPTRDKINLIHALDVSRAVILALKNSAQGAFNICGPNNITFMELAQTCIEVAGKGYVKVRGEDDTRGKTLYDLNSSKASNVFGFKPTIRIKDGIKMMMDDIIERI